jgi:hypothetical protein
MAEHGRQADPIVTQFGSRLAYFPPFTLEKGLEIERDSPLQHVIDRPAELMRQDR